MKFLYSAILLIVSTSCYSQSSTILKQRTDSLLMLFDTSSAVKQVDFQKISKNKNNRRITYHYWADNSKSKIKRTYFDGVDSVEQTFLLVGSEMVYSKEIRSETLYDQLTNLQKCSLSLYYENHILQVVFGPPIEGCKLHVESAMPDFGMPGKLKESLKDIKEYLTETSG